MAKRTSFINTHTILCFTILLVAGACTDKPMSSGAGSRADILWHIDAVLHQRMQAVLDADNAYAQTTTQAATTAAAQDTKSEGIAKAEIALQKTIDSVQNRSLKNDITTENAIAQLAGYFKTFLQSRRPLSDLRMTLSANSDDSTTMQHTVSALRAQLQEKDKKIAALEQAQSNAPVTSSSEEVRTKVTTPSNNAPAADQTATNENIASLKQQNKDLATALSTLQTKYFNVGRDFLMLKQEHERTVNELAALRKSNNQQ